MGAVMCFLPHIGVYGGGLSNAPSVGCGQDELCVDGGGGVGLTVAWDPGSWIANQWGKGLMNVFINSVQLPLLV